MEIKLPGLGKPDSANKKKKKTKIDQDAGGGGGRDDWKKKGVTNAESAERRDVGWAAAAWDFGLNEGLVRI